MIQLHVLNSCQGKWARKETKIIGFFGGKCLCIGTDGCMCTLEVWIETLRQQLVETWTWSEFSANIKQNPEIQKSKCFVL